MQSVTHVALDVRQACLMEAVDCFCAMIPDQVPPPCAQNFRGNRDAQTLRQSLAPRKLLLLLQTAPPSLLLSGAQICSLNKGNKEPF